MKTLLQTLFFVLLVTQICFAQWLQLGLDDKAIVDIASRNSNIFAVTSDSGKVYRSTDNGMHWLQIVNSCATNIEIAPSGSLFMSKRDSLNYYTYPDSLYKSSDNGNTWINLNIIDQLPPPPYGSVRLYKFTVSPTGIVFYTMWLRYSLEGWTVFALSTDDGSTWSQPGWGFVAGELFDFRGRSVITYGSYWWMLSHAWSPIYLSSDNGRNWLAEGYPPSFLDNNNSVLSLCLNENIIIGGSVWTSPGLFLSSDLGNTWTWISQINVGSGLTIESGGMLVGTDTLGVFLFSDDGDSIGSRNDGLSNLNVHTFTMDNNGYVYTGTDNGVWRRPLSEITSVEEHSTALPSSFILSQNFPNPFNPSTKISWQSPVGSQQTLKIYDILGNEVATLVNEYKSAGRYEVEFNAASLPSGVYFYQLKSGEFVETKKMILLK